MEDEREEMDTKEEEKEEKEDSKDKGKNKKKFEVKKWNAVALWAWGKYYVVYTSIFFILSNQLLSFFLSFSWLFFSSFEYVDIVVDNCAICRNHIMDLCIECQANQASATSEGIHHNFNLV